MAYPVFAVANSFIGKVVNLTPMKLQKLIYFSEYWYFKKMNEHLVDEMFYRWTYGPIIPSLYHKLKNYKAHEVKSQLSWVNQNPETGKTEIYTPYIPKDAEAPHFYINEVIENYGDYSGFQLSKLSHGKGGIWKAGEKGSPILETELQQAINP